jgi:large subunit ribosomal protein L19
MIKKELAYIDEQNKKKAMPQFQVGDTVKVFVKIVEGGKERVQAFEGIVIKRQRGSVKETFTVRKVVQGIGVERTFLVHSPRVEKISVLKSGKVRRAKLFYLRDRIGGQATRLEERETAPEKK